MPPRAGRRRREGEVLISRVEDEASASEATISAAGAAGYVRRRSLPENEFGFAGEVDFSGLALSCNSNADEVCIIRTGTAHLSDLDLEKG